MKFRGDQFARVVQMLEPASYAAAAEAFSASVDCLGYRELLLVINVGVITATGDVLIQCEDSADDVTFTDVAGATMADTRMVVANDQRLFLSRVNCESIRRYFRVGYDVDDDAAIFGITGILLHPKYAPATQVNAIEFNIA